MKNVILALLFLIMAAPITVTVSQAADESKPNHYEGKEFKDTEEAMVTLRDTSAKMAVIAASKDLDVTKMEQIHEISYTTENAIAYLDKTPQPLLKTLAYALEELHLSSEDHAVDDVRRHFITYQSYLNTYLLAQK